MIKYYKLTILISSLSLSCAALAATSVTTMDITASVAGTCSVSSSGADFGPVVQFSGDTASGTIDVTCSSGLSYNVALDAGLQVQDGGSPLCQDSCRCAKKAKWQEATESCCTSDEGRPLGVAD